MKQMLILVMVLGLAVTIGLFAFIAGRGNLPAAVEQTLEDAEETLQDAEQNLEEMLPILPEGDDAPGDERDVDQDVQEATPERLEPQGVSRLGATAQLKDAEGDVVGRVNLTSTEDGYVTIQLGLKDQGFLEPGEYGFHIHERGQCEPDFSAAGGYFNPTGAAHGLLNPDGPEAGDLPNILVEHDGTTTYVVTTALVTLGDAQTSLLREGGTAIIIQSEADDYVSVGDITEGERLACGVVEAAGQ